MHVQVSYVGCDRYYLRQASKRLLWVSAGSLVGYILSLLVYTAFSPIPYDAVSGKDVVILCSQIGMATCCLVFVVTLAFHTRCVSYAAVIHRTFTVM